MTKNRHALLSLFLTVLMYGTDAQKRSLQAQADVPAIRRKAPCRRPRCGLQFIGRR